MVTLSNGLRVANFSSPHPFTFTDGSVLPACTPEDAERLQVTFYEIQLTQTTCKLEFSLSSEVWKEMAHWQREQLKKHVDFVLVPLPMMQVLKEHHSTAWILKSPYRCIRMCDRIKKLVCIDKFTI